MARGTSPATRPTPSVQARPRRKPSNGAPRAREVERQAQEPPTTIAFLGSTPATRARALRRERRRSSHDRRSAIAVVDTAKETMRSTISAMDRECSGATADANRARGCAQSGPSVRPCTNWRTRGSSLVLRFFGRAVEDELAAVQHADAVGDREQAIEIARDHDHRGVRRRAARRGGARRSSAT